MKLGIEHREQVYFLVGLVMAAGYVVYVTMRPVRAEQPPPPSHYRARQSTGKNQPFSPTPRQNSKKVAVCAGVHHGPGPVCRSGYRAAWPGVKHLDGDYTGRTMPGLPARLPVGVRV